MSVRAEERKSWKKKGGEVAGFKQARFTFTVTSLRLGAAGLLWATSSALRQSFRPGCSCRKSWHQKLVSPMNPSEAKYDVLLHLFHGVLVQLDSIRMSRSKDSLISLTRCSLHSHRFTPPINSCVIRPSHILPFLPAPYPRIAQHSQTNSNLRPPYIIYLTPASLQPNPSPPPTIHISPHVSRCPPNALFRALHNFLLNAPICHYFFFS